MGEGAKAALAAFEDRMRRIIQNSRDMLHL